MIEQDIFNNLKLTTKMIKIQTQCVLVKGMVSRSNFCDHPWGCWMGAWKKMRWGGHTLTLFSYLDKYRCSCSSSTKSLYRSLCTLQPMMTTRFPLNSLWAALTPNWIGSSTHKASWPANVSVLLSIPTTANRKRREINFTSNLTLYSVATTAQIRSMLPRARHISHLEFQGLVCNAFMPHVSCS